MRALWPAFEVTEISDDYYRSTMGVYVTTLGTPRSARENSGCTTELLGLPATSLGVLAITLEAPRITVVQFGKNRFFENAAGAPGNHSYYLLFNNF
jgi:hypothetical protein